jgi:hypothetical protein
MIRTSAAATTLAQRNQRRLTAAMIFLARECLELKGLGCPAVR